MGGLPEIPDDGWHGRKNVGEERTVKDGKNGSIWIQAG